MYHKIDVPMINILYVRNIINPLPEKDPNLFVFEQLDGTYTIYQYNQPYHSDFHNRLAYNFNFLTEDIQKQYIDDCKHMIKNGNGSYYEESKKYVKKNEV